MLPLGSRLNSLISDLKKEGCSFASILRALAEYAKQREDWALVAHHLLMAATEVDKAHQRITGSD